VARSFTIETTTDSLKADAKEPAKVAFTVINVASRPVRALATVKPLGDTKREWLSIAGETERDIGRGDKERFTVIFNTAGAPAGTYQFRLDVASAVAPEEDFTNGPTVTVEVAARPIVKPKPFPKWIIPVIAGVVLLIGAVLAWRIFGGDNSTQAVSYKLPDVEDLVEERARKRLEDECNQPDKRCVLVEVNQVFDDKVAEGRTIRTEPAAGTEVELGSKVMLFTSRGPSRVPSVANQTADAAQKLLETMCQQVGCKVETSRSPHDTVPADMAIGTKPGENEALKANTTVTLLVSSGPEMKAVGSYLNVFQPIAEQLIAKDGFTVGRVDIVRDHRVGAVGIAGTVRRQDPPPGTMRPKGSKIDLEILQVVP
jgi:eukaryotic-like serine/threonine-protein kinase